MFCERCGAVLREGDLFCSRCGAPVVKPPGKEHPERERAGDRFQETFYGDREVYYDENLYRDDKPRYRDSFLDKKEEKSHALLVTVTILLVMAVLTAAFVILFFFSRRSGMLSGGEENEIVLLTETETEEKITENPVSGTEKATGEEILIENRNEENAQLQTETDVIAESVEESIVDVEKIGQILSQDSTVTRSEVYIYDLNHFKEYCTEDSDEPMYASALISVPVLYTAAYLLDQGQITLNDQITYVNSIGGRGLASPEEREGQSFPLTYYLTTMMSYSDNNCINCLIDYLGLDQINQTCKSAGFSSVDMQRKIVAEVTDGKDNYVSAKDLAGMFKELYLGKYKTIGGEFMKQYFKIDAGDSYRTVIGLADSIPSSALFLNQNGKGDTRYNEIALVSDDTHQYIICIMCNGDYGFQYETAVENISNYVYQSLTRGGQTNE